MQIVDILQECEDIFSEEMSSGLPPLRGIEHQIDFVYDAWIPNAKTVNELLENGQVRDRLSSCAVLVIMAPRKKIRSVYVLTVELLIRSLVSIGILYPI